MGDLVLSVEGWRNSVGEELQPYIERWRVAGSVEEHLVREAISEIISVKGEERRDRAINLMIPYIIDRCTRFGDGVYEFSSP